MDEVSTADSPLFTPALDAFLAEESAPHPSTSAGWYADPWRQAERRWYDGTRWTPYLDDKDQPSSLIQRPAGPQSIRQRRQIIRRQRRAALGVSDFVVAGLFTAIGLFFLAMGALATADRAPFWTVVSWFVAFIFLTGPIASLSGQKMTQKPKAPKRRYRVRFFWFFRL